MALAANERYENGFVINTDTNSLVTTDDPTGATMQSGLLRDPDGRIVTTGGAMAAARATRLGVQTIPSGALTLLTFGAERYDRAALHDITTNNWRMTAVRSGLYMAVGLIEWAANATGFRSLVLRHNGTTEVGDDTRQAVTGGVVTRQTAMTVMELAAGDYLELLAAQTSGGNLDILAAGNYSPEFILVRLSA